MIGTRPSFYRLFRRSGYYRALDESDDSDDAEIRRQERERFAAAAIAFCLIHDETFFHYFWTSVCRVPGDPVDPPHAAERQILIEPPRWADIRINASCAVARYIWVVEVKAGAKLESIQDPRSTHFARPHQGYGWFLHNEKAHSRTKLRYIVFGYEKPLRLSPRHRQLGIALQQRKWADIALLATTPLTSDLAESLGRMNIEPFATKLMIDRAANIRVKTGLHAVGDVKTVLEAIYGWLGITARRDYEFYSEEASAVIGIYIRDSQNFSKAHAQLQRATRCGDPEAWLGYRADAKGEITRSVWLYFSSIRKQKRIHSVINKLFSAARRVEDPPSHCVVVEEAAAVSAISDFAWFTSVLQGMGVKAKGAR